MHKQEETHPAQRDAATIAVVDDDSGVRAALCNLLESAGYRSCVFASGEQLLASECLQTALCVLVDVELAGMSGFELQQQLAVVRPELPLIFMSAHGSLSYRLRAAQLSPIALLIKPVDADLLLAGIRLVARAPEDGP